MTLNDIVRVIALEEQVPRQETRIFNDKYTNKIKMIGVYINEIVDLIRHQPIYIKKAIGKNGKEINVYKIRTMVIDADKQVAELLKRKNNLDHQGKLKNDSRITNIGRFMRENHLDELPQIYNVIKGDMKLVGIRPMEKIFWNEIYSQETYHKAIKSKPGLWGENYAVSKKRCANSKDEKQIHLATTRLYLREYEKNPLKTDLKFFAAGVYNKLRGESSS